MQLHLLNGMITLNHILQKLWLLKLHDIDVFKTSCFIYKSRHGLLPPQFCNLFVLNSEVYHHDTRNKNLIHQVSHGINARALSINCYGVKIWNSLPIQNSPTFTIFKKYVKLIYWKHLVFLYKSYWYWFIIIPLVKWSCYLD